MAKMDIPKNKLITSKIISELVHTQTREYNSSKQDETMDSDVYMDIINMSPGFLAEWWKWPSSTSVPGLLGYCPRVENQIKIRHHSYFV